MPAKPNWKKTTFGYQGPEVGLHSVFAPASEVARKKCGGLFFTLPSSYLVGICQNQKATVVHGPTL